MEQQNPLIVKHYLLQGDCLELLATIPDGSVDMVLADLPYGTTASKWDSVIPFEPLWAEYKRICTKNAAIVLTAQQPFTSALVMSNVKAFKQALVWKKNKSSGHLNAKRRHLTVHEDVLLFSFGTPVYNPQKTTGHTPSHSASRLDVSTVYGRQRHTTYEGGQTTRMPNTLLAYDVVNNDGSGEGRFHPNQKPVPLLEYLINTYSRPGELVLDNTMGSGTTGVAALNTGRLFIGMEKDPAFYKVAVARIEAALDNR